jgi:HAD superfamily hydrolase (TIGR01490 family)
VSLAIFDLDNTLIANDSDYLWGQFLVDKGIVDKEKYDEANKQFYEDYKNGTLDIVEFLNFSLAPLAQHEAEQLHRWREEFIEELIKPVVLTNAMNLVEKHRQRGDTLLVITATNRFITAPIVELYGIRHLLATTPEFLDGRYTGHFHGVPCYQEGKITYLKEWLKDQNTTLSDSWFYSDSHNDLPLLRIVDHPIAVDPDETLRNEAKLAGWDIITLRDSVFSE